MGITLLVVGVTFVAILAIGYFGYQGIAEEEARREQQQPDKLVAGSDSCGLCSAPLRRAATSDEVVFEIEHRIHDELAAIAHALHAPPQGLGRMPRA